MFPICAWYYAFGGKGDLWENIGAVNQSGVDDIIKASIEAGINFKTGKPLV
ncbi:MAG: hypothetical protein ACRCXC_06065 [Legionella sp.]